MSFINKELYENADSQRKATQITWEIADCLHQVGAPTYNALIILISSLSVKFLILNIGIYRLSKVVFPRTSF